MLIKLADFVHNNTFTNKKLIKCNQTPAFNVQLFSFLI